MFLRKVTEHVVFDNPLGCIDVCVCVFLPFLKCFSFSLCMAVCVRACESWCMDLMKNEYVCLAAARTTHIGIKRSHEAYALHTVYKYTYIYIHTWSLSDVMVYVCACMWTIVYVSRYYECTFVYVNVYVFAVNVYVCVYGERTLTTNTNSRHLRYRNLNDTQNIESII